MDEIRELFGGDPYPYGVEANRGTLETFMQYLVEQGFVAEPRPALERPVHTHRGVVGVAEPHTTRPNRQS